MLWTPGEMGPANILARTPSVHLNELFVPLRWLRINNRYIGIFTQRCDGQSTIVAECRRTAALLRKRCSAAPILRTPEKTLSNGTQHTGHGGWTCEKYMHERPPQFFLICKVDCSAMWPIRQAKPVTNHWTRQLPPTTQLRSVSYGATTWSSTERVRLLMLNTHSECVQMISTRSCDVIMTVFGGMPKPCLSDVDRQVACRDMYEDVPRIWNEGAFAICISCCDALCSLDAVAFFTAS